MDWREAGHKGPISSEGAVWDEVGVSERCMANLCSSVPFRSSCPSSRNRPELWDAVGGVDAWRFLQRGFFPDSPISRGTRRGVGWEESLVPSRNSADRCSSLRLGGKLQYCNSTRTSPSTALELDKVLDLSAALLVNIQVLVFTWLPTSSRSWGHQAHPADASHDEKPQYPKNSVM